MVTGEHTDLEFFRTTRLEEGQVRRWRDFASRVPWPHYRQDPDWAETERYGRGMARHEPWFFWAESRGAICLSAIGVERRLPVPGYAFWEFGKGPTVLETGVLDEWLSWLLPTMGRGVARLRIEPAMPLDQGGGSDVETLLERHGFVRPTKGPGATLLVDIAREEEEIMAGFRTATQRSIRKSRRLGIEVNPEDTPEGWRVLAALQTELSRTAPVTPVDQAAIERISRNWLRGGTGGNVLIARHNGEVLAAALVITYRDTAYLPLIPSSRRHKQFPASHLLIWEAMRWAKRQRCTTLDLVGYGLEAQPGDAIWGINQFKRGFASLDHISKSVGVHERVSSPIVLASATAIRECQAWWRRHSGSRIG